MIITLRIAFSFGRAREAFLERFTSALESIVRHDLSIPDGLAEAARERGWAGFGHIISDLSSRTDRAEPLSTAMARWPRVFDSGYIATIRAGELSSSLDEVVGLLDDHVHLRGELSGLLRRAIVYPVVVLGVTIAALTVFGWLSGPLFLELLEPSAPMWLAPFVLLAKIAAPLGALSTLLVAYLAATAHTVAEPSTRLLVLYRLPLVLPFVGNAYRQATRALLCRAIATEIEASVPLDEALAHAANLSRNPAVRDELNERAEVVRAGGRLPDFAGRHDVFDPVVSSLLDAAWGGDQLPDALGRIADSDEQSLRNFIEVSTPLVELVFLCAVAVLAGAAAIAQFGVYFQSLAAFPH